MAGEATRLYSWVVIRKPGGETDHHCEQATYPDTITRLISYAERRGWQVDRVTKPWRQHPEQRTLTPAELKEFRRLLKAVAQVLEE